MFVLSRSHRTHALPSAVEIFITSDSCFSREETRPGGDETNRPKAKPAEQPAEESVKVSHNGGGGPRRKPPRSASARAAFLPRSSPPSLFNGPGAWRPSGATSALRSRGPSAAPALPPHQPKAEPRAPAAPSLGASSRLFSLSFCRSSSSLNPSSSGGSVISRAACATLNHGSR